MQVKINKTFEVKQPIARVWEFLSDPRKVVTCIPGAQITEALDVRRYLGTISAKVGPVLTDYKGELIVERLDAQNYEIGLLGKGTRSEEHTSELQSRENLVCRLLLEKKKFLQLLTNIN